VIAASNRYSTVAPAAGTNNTIAAAATARLLTNTIIPPRKRRASLAAKFRLRAEGEASRDAKRERALWHRRATRPDPDLGLLLRRGRSEEHTSELQSLRHLVCRLLLEKK